MLFATLARIRHPATWRLNSGVRRQKNILFQPRLACPAAPLTFAPLPSLAAALIAFGSQTMLRTASNTRSSFAYVAFVRFGNSGWFGLLSDKTRYGLNQENVTSFERLEIASDSIADAWISARFNKEGTVQIVYGEEEVSVLSAADFVSHWRSIFVPCRDDAIILHNFNKSILFYCHEDELEHGMRAA